MQFLGVLLSSFFAHSLVLSGYGFRQNASLGARKTKYRWIVLSFYFVEALILGFAGWGFRSLAANQGMWTYLTPLFSVLIMALCLGGFVLLAHFCFSHQIKTDLADSYIEIGLNSSLLALVIVLLSYEAGTDATILVGSIVCLPLGYLAASYATGAVLDRLSFAPANGPSRFATMPLLLLSIAGLCLGCWMMTF